MVPALYMALNQQFRPVPVGTDGSVKGFPILKQWESRPCGDGWFYLENRANQRILVPSLRGRMVPIAVSKDCWQESPVHTWTDGSSPESFKKQWGMSRPYGTDGSLPNLFRSLPTQSRPYGDGWF